MSELVQQQVQDGKTGDKKDITYTREKVVGNGSFGVVFKTVLIPSNETAAIKRVLQDKRYKNRELEIMRRVCHHPNVCQLKAFFYSTEQATNEVFLNLIMEFVPETVFKAIDYFTARKSFMPVFEVKLYSYQLFRSLAYIHSLGICHRDIKPQNLLLNPHTGVLKLCDFGSAKVLVPEEQNISYICSRYYRAPELIFGATNYTTKIDVWSSGCVMAEMFLGHPLFSGETSIDHLVEIIRVLGTPTKEQIKTMNPNYVNNKFPQTKACPLTKVFRKHTQPDAIDLIGRLLQYSHGARLSAIQVLLHPFFDELRDPATRFFTDSRNIPSTTVPLPPLFNCSRLELSIAPDLNHRLVPPHAKAALLEQTGIDLDNFVPLRREEFKTYEE